MAIYPFTNFNWLLNIGVWDFWKPVTELSAMKNVQEDRIGILKRVPWYSKATTDKVNAATCNVNFLHYYFQPSSGNNYLIAWANSWANYTLEYKLDTWDWTAISWASYTDRADAELSAVNYLGKMFIVWYDATDAAYLAPATLSWTTYTTSSGTDADLTNMPSGKFIVRYRDLIYVLNARIGSTNYKSRAYYCTNPVNLSLDTPWWDVATDFIEFGQDDWDEITGWADCADRLVVFTRNSMWTYDESNKKKLADVWCDSYKSIKVINWVLYWANRYGMWRWDWAVPQLISGKVQPFFDAIVQSNLNKMVWVIHWFEYRLFVWNITLDWITYTNAWIVFDVRREKFYIRCTYHTCLSAARFIESSKERIYFWSDTGYVYKKATYNESTAINSDDWNEIDWFFHTNQLDFWSAQIVKVSPATYIFTKNAAWMKYIIDWNNGWEFDIYRDQIQTNKVFVRDVSVSWYRFTFKFYWKDSNDPFEFEGFICEVLWLENI